MMNFRDLATVIPDQYMLLNLSANDVEVRMFPEKATEEDPGAGAPIIHSYIALRFSGPRPQ